MSLSRWKIMAGVLGVSLGGLAAASQCPKTETKGQVSRQAPMPGPEIPVGPKLPPAGGASPKAPAPAVPDSLPPKTPPTPTTPELPAPPTADLPVALPGTPASPPAPVSGPTTPALPAPPVVPAGGMGDSKKADPPALPAPDKGPEIPGLGDPLVKPLGPTTPAAPTALPADKGPMTAGGTPSLPSLPDGLGRPMPHPGAPAADPGVKPTSAPPVGAPSPFPDSPPMRAVPTGGTTGIEFTKPAATPEVKPEVKPAAAVAAVKFRILLQVGEGEPKFEVKYGDDLVLKVQCERIDIKSPEKGNGPSDVRASGKVRFVGFGAEGVCDELSFLAGTGEVKMSGKVKIAVKDKLGRVESELTTDTAMYKVDPAVIVGALRP